MVKSHDEEYRKIQKKWILIFLVLLPIVTARANDSLILAQSYIHLSLTSEYYDLLSGERISHILPFVENQLENIRDQSFLTQNSTLLNLTYGHYFFLKAKMSFREYSEINRKNLISSKNDIEKVYSLLQKTDRNTWYKSAYYESIGVTEDNYISLHADIYSFKKKLESKFNLDIYPDIQRILLMSKNGGRFYFDSLNHYAGIYDMNIDFSILENAKVFVNSQFDRENEDYVRYRVSFAIDLISKYLQLSYIVEHGLHVQSNEDLHLNFEYVEREVQAMLNEKDWSVSDEFPDYIPSDDFLKNELSKKTIDKLSKKLKMKYPREVVIKDSLLKVPTVAYMKAYSPLQYFFPKIAPNPSAKISVQNFIPDSVNLGQVDSFIRRNFEAAGYSGRLNYFYLYEPGFAVTTGIERIENDGSPKSPDDIRWDLTARAEGNFSLYRIFKAIFFATESNFRMIACIVSGNEYATEPGEPTFSDDIFSNRGYSSLPEELKESVLSRKTLTILVYQFYQSDIGQVPIIDTSRRFTVFNHLEKTSSLKNLIESRQ